MKSNQISIFIVLILSVVIGGLLYFLERSSDEDLGWSPNEMYGELGARSYDGSSFTNATLSGASNGGVALSMPHTSFSIRTRVTPTTYSPSPIAHRQSPITNIQSPIAHRQSPIANGPSPIAYMTSGAEYRSFGGGGNGNMGSAGTFRASAQSPISNSQSPIAYSPSPIAYSPSPIAYSQLPISNSPSPISNTPATVASGSNPAGLFSYALQTSYGTASYDANTYQINSRNGVRGKQKAGITDSWLAWLYQHMGDYGMTLGGDVHVYTEEQLRAAYEDFYKDWDDMWGTNPKPDFEVWLNWMKGAGGGGYEHNNVWFLMAPVGNVLPLFILALIYMVILFVKRNKIAQL